MPPCFVLLPPRQWGRTPLDLAKSNGQDVGKIRAAIERGLAKRGQSQPQAPARKPRAAPAAGAGGECFT